MSLHVWTILQLNYWYGLKNLWEWGTTAASADYDDYYGVGGGGVCSCGGDGRGVWGLGGADEYVIDTAVVFPSTETTITKKYGNYSSVFKTSVCWLFNCMLAI